MENNNTEKIVTVSFVVIAALVGFAVSVLLEVLAASWGKFSTVYPNTMVKHGIPVLVALGTFAYMMTSKAVREWGFEVVSEVGRVVWPSRKDTSSLTIFVTIIILISGFLLGFIDLLSTLLMKFILNFTI